MKVIDMTGPIQDGMWNYEAPFPTFHLQPLPKVPWVNNRVYCEIFEGIHSQTGTYLETPAHFFGNDQSYLLADVPVEHLYRQPCHLLEIILPPAQGRFAITKSMLETALGHRKIQKGESIIIGTGWGSHWHSADYLEKSPYFTYDAMMWLIQQRPFLLGSDFPRWENLEKPEGFFPDFYAADILMLAPCVHTELIEQDQFLLTVLPMNIPGTSCCPCRAIAEINE